MAAHDTQPPPPPRESPPCPPPGPEAEPVPQAALETVLREQSEGGEEKKESFYQWFGAKVRQNSLSEYLRDRFYDDEVEKLNPTCSVIGFLLRTTPVCPVVRKLEECAYTGGRAGGWGWGVEMEGGYMYRSAPSNVESHRYIHNITHTHIHTLQTSSRRRRR